MPQKCSKDIFLSPALKWSENLVNPLNIRGREKKGFHNTNAFIFYAELKSRTKKIGVRHRGGEIKFYLLG